MKNKKILFAVFFLTFFSTLSVFSQSQQNDNEKIKSLIAKKRSYNKNTGFGYRIQLFYGKENKVKRIRVGFQVRYPNVSSYIRYEKPYWKLKIGDYKTKLIADRALVVFKEKYSGAIVIPKSKG